MYNPEKPLYTSAAVKTYNCMNTETKNKRLIIVEHLTPPPFVEPSPGILQPIEIPTTAEPFSIYPITICVSEVGKLSEPDVSEISNIGHVFSQVHLRVQAEEAYLHYHERSRHLLLRYLRPVA